MSPFKSPFAPFFGLLRRIPSPRVRRAVHFGVFFLLSLVVGRVCEFVFDKATLDAAVATQSRWIETVRALAPLQLARGYLDDLGPAARGEVIYRQPPARSAESAVERLVRERRTACRVALRFGGAGALPPACVAIGVTDPVAFVLEESRAPASAETPATPAPSSVRNNVPVFLVPLAALLRSGTRIAAIGWSAAVFALVQLLSGVLGVLVLTRALSHGRTTGFDSVPGNLILLPLGAVVLGSLLAWVLQWLMLGGLMAFHGVTELAATAAGATGVTGFCWYCVTKLGEKGAEGAVTGKG